MSEPPQLTIILLKSKCSRCNITGYHDYCRQCGAMYCEGCDCYCDEDEQ